MTGEAMIDRTGEPTSPWREVCVIEQGVLMLAEDVCRISLRRGPTSDALRLSYMEITSLDLLLEFPATTGSDADAARAALAAAATAGHTDSIQVLSGGILSADECREILTRGEAAHREARDRERAQARAAALAAEALQPSRILATARDLHLVPEPVGKHQWFANCPGTNHKLMLGTRSEDFGCGYCQVRGGPEELVAFTRRRREARGRP